ncbi:Type 1 glutamine amidotransferase-like domain-containing protein [Candidatus Uabimicrobium sp. HlEnr_7]|uniref:Type 1 glutamine amidotransferase-like domain-containing protein n=1 Tax=Candidatus Uabimicrobium helgolandensis TaxID=3095367 RepID=UPI0035562082
MFQPTALVYSSHNRSPYLHRNWIIEPALKSHDNKTILQLPMSMKEQHQQDYSWGNFRWYFDQFKQWGLEYSPFFWNDNLSGEDLDVLFEKLRSSQVVVLGGGNSLLGIKRYRELGRLYCNDENLFAKILQERASNGKLTVGFSAGASQLCEYLTEAIDHHLDNPHGFALAANVMVTLHHEWGREQEIYECATKFQHCAAFGLPNDSGIAVEQGHLPSGNFYQVIQFIVDGSWDMPEDNFHIKTRQGMKIEHYYNDSRKWTFNDQDLLVRISSNDGYSGAWIIQDEILDYWTQQPSGYNNLEQILANH